MAEFVPVTKVGDLSPGRMKWVAVNRERVLLVNVEGMFYALSDACGHQRVPLSKGRLEGYVVESYGQNIQTPCSSIGYASTMVHAST